LICRADEYPAARAQRAAPGQPPERKRLVLATTLGLGLTIPHRPVRDIVLGELTMMLLLLLPFIGLLWVPFYNQTTPELFGFPFFYWYQIAWVPISSLLTFIVWRSTHRGGDK
jgi:hypothetical protein